MSRVENCIKMLMALSRHQEMSREQLAQELDCNIRNIGEYKKELEACGYEIISTRGKEGGYSLKKNILLPVLGFTREESKVLLDAYEYLNTNKVLFNDKAYQDAMSKILTQVHNEEKKTFLNETKPVLSPTLKHYYEVIEMAIKDHRQIRLFYQGNKDHEPKWIRVNPYSLIHDKNGYYLIAFKTDDLYTPRRFFFSVERMKDVQPSLTTFAYDNSFKLSDHIGNTSVSRLNPCLIKVYVFNNHGRWLREKPQGYNYRYTMDEDEKMYYEASFDNEVEAIHFLLQLEDQVEIIEPLYLKEKMQHLLENMLKKYQGL